MFIRSIKTEEDHRAAVARIDQLMGSVPESPDDDEINMLATLVDAYEAEHYPIDSA